MRSGLYFSRTEARGQGQSDTEKAGDTPHPQDISAYQILDCSLKLYRRYARRTTVIMVRCDQVQLI